MDAYFPVWDSRAIDATVRSLIEFNKPLSRVRIAYVRSFVVRASLEIKLPVKIFSSLPKIVKKKEKIIIVIREKGQIFERKRRKSRNSRKSWFHVKIV